MILIKYFTCAATNAIRSSSRSDSEDNCKPFSVRGLLSTCLINCIREAAKLECSIRNTISSIGAHRKTLMSHRNTYKR